MTDFVVSPRFERPPAPNGGWLKSALGTALWEAPLFAAIAAATLNCSYVVSFGPRYQSPYHDTAPEPAWVFNAIPPAPPSTYGDAARNCSYLVGRRAPLVLGTHDTAPEAAWIFGALPPPPPPPPTYPPGTDVARNSYRVPSRAPLVLGTHDTAPESAWILKALPPSTLGKIHVWVFPEPRQTAFPLLPRPGVALSARLTESVLEPRDLVVTLSARSVLIVLPPEQEGFVTLPTTIKKHPTESLNIGIDYTSRLSVGEAIVGVVASVVPNAPPLPTTAVIVGAPTFVGNIVKVPVSVGLDGQTDSVLVGASTSGTQTLAAVVDLAVSGRDF